MSEKNIGVVDWGSSKAVVNGKVVFNYTRRTYQGVAGESPTMAYIEPVEFGEMMRTLEVEIGKPDVIGITGLNHSLVPWVKNGVVRTAVVGDEPSLSPAGGLSTELKAYYPEEKTSSISAVRKLAGLQNHPELMDILFGRNWYGDIGYTTMLSLAAMRLLGEEDDMSIFPDEAMDFRADSRLEKGGIPGVFGLSQDQLRFGEDEVRRNENREVWVMQDLRADLKVIRKLFDKGMIPGGAMILATDSILKRISDGYRGGTRSMEGLYYDTMRTMGTTGPKYVMPIARARGEANDIGSMFRFFDKTLRESSMPQNWFYDPREDEGRGQLWEKNGLVWRRKTAEAVAADSKIDYKKVVQAYGWGMAAAMYEGIESENMENVVIYGGLMGLFGTAQLGWKHVFTQSAPNRTNVNWLRMPDSSRALEMVIRESYGEKLDYAKEVPVEQIGRGGGELTKWLDMKNEIISKNS